MNYRPSRAKLILSVATACCLSLLCATAGPHTACAQGQPAADRPAGADAAAGTGPAGLSVASAQGDEPQPKEEGRSIQEIIAFVLLLTIPIALIVLMTRLQRKRLQASKEATKRQKEQARLSRPGQDL